MMNDEAIIERLQDAVIAYTANADGRADSLDALLDETPVRRSRRRTVVSMSLLTTGAAAGVAAIVFGAAALQGPSSSSSVQPLQRSGVTSFSATRIAAPTDARYPSTAYFISRQVTKLTRKVMDSKPVIVRSADLKVVQTLPIALSDAQLTSDGTRVYGYYAGSAGGAGTDNSASTNPAVKKLVDRDLAGHAVYLDFSTGDVVELGKAAWPGIVGMTITPDGSTVAYSRIVKSNGKNFAVGEQDQPGESSVIRVVDVATAKWHEFTVAHHQSLGLALSPDATKLAFTKTQTANILFLADLSQANPATAARAVVPPPACRKGAYDYPMWTDAGLFAAQECEPAKAQVVSIDPTTLLPVGGPLAPLPDGGVLHLNLYTNRAALEFGYVPVRGSTAADNGDMRIGFRNNEEWLIASGGTTGHRSGFLWSP